MDAQEQQIWRSYLAATRLLAEHLERDLQRHAGIPLQYYEILVRLSEAPGRTMRMSELADRSQSSRSRLSHAVARLEHVGWVRRDSCPSDRRGQLAVLTGNGFAALRAAAPHHVASVRKHLLDGLSQDQLAQLGVISRVLLDHLSALRVSPA